MKKKISSYILNFALVIITFVVLNTLILNGIIDPYYERILKLIFINILLAVSLNLSTGFLGQLVLGHAGFMSVGAYVSSLFTMNIMKDMPNISFPIALLCGGLFAALFGIIIGIPALRLRGDYLAILTLGFGEIIKVIINALDFTGGARGLIGIPSLSSFTYVFFVVALSVAIIYTFVNSRHGRAVKSIRENEIAAESSGVNTTYYKLLAFVVAAFFAGIAGGLYAHYVGVINPSKFDFNYSIEILVIVVLGGMGSITGSIIAAIVLTIIPELLQSVSEYRMVIYAVVLIVVMLFRPTGLLGGYELSLRRILKKIRKAFSKNKQSNVKQAKGDK